MVEVAGHESYTPDGYLQVTSAGIYWRSEGKIEVDTSQWIGGTPVYTRDIFVAGYSLNDQPIIALASNDGCFGTTVEGNGGIIIRLWCLRVVPITVYLFTNRRPTDPGMGAVAYDQTGPVWSALTPTLMPIGVFDANGYAGQPLVGRICAHVPQRRSDWFQFEFRIENCTYSGGTSGQPQVGFMNMRKENISSVMVSCINSTVQARSNNYSTPFSSFGGCSSANPGAAAPYYSTLQLDYRSVIVDVTAIT